MPKDDAMGIELLPFFTGDKASAISCDSAKGSRRINMKTAMIFLALFTFLILILERGPSHILNDRISTRRSISHRTQGPLRLSNLSYPVVTKLPRRPEPGVCWIIGCGNQTLRHRQMFRGPGFRFIDYGLPKFIVEEGLHPMYCRLGPLRDTLRMGHRCVLWADDDVYLNLTATRNAIHESEEDVLVVAQDAHGSKQHINSGLVIFRDLHAGKFGGMVIEMWYAARFYPKWMPWGYLRDQGALNYIINCKLAGVRCFLVEEGEDKDLGLIRQCFSIFDKKIYKGAKVDCLRKSKRQVTLWDELPATDDFVR